MLPSADELLYFQEVCSTLNLSRASERLGISQPSLSVAIKKLEKTIGTELFIRSKSGVTLTQAGKQLWMHSRQLMQYWQTTKSQALAAKHLVQGHFKVGCPSTIAMHTLAPILPKLLRQFPQLEIQLKHDIARKITEEVINLSLDIGIVVNPIRHPDLIIRNLCQDVATLWIGQKKNALQDTVIYNPEILQAQNLLKQCKKANIHFQRMMTINSFEVIATLTAHGAGIGILPERVANFMYQHQLKRLAKAPTCLDEICVVYRSENRDVAAIRAIIDALFHSKTDKSN